MNKNLKEFKKVYLPTLDFVGCEGIKLIIKILEDFEKRLERLEQKISDCCEVDADNIKIGGTDPE